MKDFNLRKHGDKLLFVLALAVLAAALFRLGGKTAITQVTAPTIVFTQWWHDDLGEDVLDDLIEEFENLNSGIKVTLNAVPYEDLRLTLFNSVETVEGGASIPGDVIALDPLWVPELLERKTVENTEPPFLSFINVLYYNVEMLKEADFFRPPKNRSEFLACAEAVTNKEEKRWGLTLGGDSSRLMYDDVYPWFWAAGEQLIKDGNPVLNSRQFVDTFSFLASLHKEGFTVPGMFFQKFSGGDIGAHGTKLEDFVSGRAAFMIAPINAARFVRERMGDENFGITSVPAPDNYAGKSFFGTASWTAGVNAASAHKEEARLFTAFLAGKAQLFSEKAGAIPGSASSPPQANDPFRSKAWDIAISGECAHDFSDLPDGHELAAIFREELAALFSGQSVPADTAAAIQKKWEAVLTEK